MKSFVDVETSGLNHKEDSVSVFGWLDGDGLKQFRSGEDFRKFYHAKLLNGLRISDVVSYNGKAFDNNFLKEIGVDIEGHTDLMEFMIKEHGRFVSKKDACRLYNIRSPPDIITGRECAEFAKAKFKQPLSFELVCLHNAIDLYETAALHETLKARVLI